MILSVTTVSIMTHSITVFGIMAFIISTRSIIIVNRSDTQHNYIYHKDARVYAECLIFLGILSVVMLNVIILSVIRLSVIRLSLIRPSLIGPSLIRPSVIRPSVIRLSVNRLSVIRLSSVSLD